MIDITRVLRELAVKRPVFHSEADFQHALAWEIHQRWPECSMRLEFKPPHLENPIYLDIWADGGDKVLALELKYKTRRTQLQARGENFDLLHHGAHPLGRYDFLKDVVRLEMVTESRSDICGYAILLTNDSMYWTAPKGIPANDASFRVHEGRLVRGKLAWGEGYAPSTIRNRESSLDIRGSYPSVWQEYSEVSGSALGRFRYLLVNVAYRNNTQTP